MKKALNKTVKTKDMHSGHSLRGSRRQSRSTASRRAVVGDAVEAEEHRAGLLLYELSSSAHRESRRRSTLEVCLYTFHNGPSPLSMNGRALLDILSSTYRYSPPVLLETKTDSTAPFTPAIPLALHRHPAFLVHATELDSLLLETFVSTLDSDIRLERVNSSNLQGLCEDVDRINARLGSPHFRDLEISSEGDVTMAAGILIQDLNTVLKTGYGTKIITREQRRIGCQRPDRFVTKYAGRVVVWEDQGWHAFNQHASQILRIATSEEGRALIMKRKEEHARAILYKVFENSQPAYCDSHPTVDCDCDVRRKVTLGSVIWRP